MQWLFPKDYIEPTRAEVGGLQSVTVDSGFFFDVSTVETSEGVYAVGGIASGTKGAPVVLTGTGNPELDDKLCIGDSEDSGACYPLIRTGQRG